MAWSTNRTRIQWPLYQRFLAIACAILFIPLTIAVLVVLGLIPIYLTNRAVYITRTNVAPPFNVTYVLVDRSIRSPSDLNLNSMDRVKMARSFERGLNLRVRNVLQIHHIYSDIAIGRNSRSRRKRLVHCDRDLSGPVLIFDFNLTYPINRICQSQKCVDQTFAEVYEQFQSVPSLSVDFNNISREISLCSFNATLNAVAESSETVAPPGSNAQDSPAASLSNGGSNTNTSSTEMPISSTTNVSSTNISSGNGSSAINTSSTNIPNGNTSTTIDIAFTGTSVTTISSFTGTISSTESSNFTSNETDVDVTDCLKKLPIIQESVPPYRITHTSTLFFQGDHSLIVAGAFKFETFMDIGTIDRTITIDGEMVYRNCQRTTEVSLPIVYHYPISS